MVPCCFRTCKEPVWKHANDLKSLICQSRSIMSSSSWKLLLNCSVAWWSLCRTKSTLFPCVENKLMSLLCRTDMGAWLSVLAKTLTLLFLFAFDLVSARLARAISHLNGDETIWSSRLSGQRRMPCLLLPITVLQSMASVKTRMLDEVLEQLVISTKECKKKWCWKAHLLCFQILWFFWSEAKHTIVPHTSPTHQIVTDFATCNVCPADVWLEARTNKKEIIFQLFQEH